MFPRLRHFGAVGVAVVAAMCAGPVRADVRSADEVLSDYLEAAGLDRLLAAHLELRLSEATGAARSRLARRIGEAYARLLESAGEEARRRYEASARRLLAEIPEADTLDLRLTLARSAYARAEMEAERWRLRLNSRAEADDARRSFEELERTLSDLAAAAGKRVAALEKQEESSTGVEAERTLLASALMSARRIRSMAHYLAGWSAYYVAELDAGATAGATNRALRHFGWLLNARAGEAPTIERVPEQLLAYEHVARSVVGVALCESLRKGDEEALRWLGLIESFADTPRSVASQLGAWRMVILGRASRWRDLSLWGDSTVGGAGMSPTEARLLAVIALEARAAGEPIEALRPLLRLSLGSLAATGQSGQVFDLASRFVAEPSDLGEGGFLAAYIRGMREYDRARRLHDVSGRGERPATDAAARRAFESAEQFLNQAIGAADAAEFGGAVGGAAMYRGQAAYYSAESAAGLERAAGVLLDAADRLHGYGSGESARAMLLAIRALEEAREEGARDAGAVAARREAVIEVFLSRHSNHPAAGALVYERALRPGRPLLDAARELLTIPDESSLSSPARHQASRLLYERWLNADAESRSEAASEFLGVAWPVVEELRRTVDPRDAGAASRAVATMRRVIDCLLSSPEADSERARRAVDLLANLVLRGAPAPADIGAELDYRRVQIAVLEGDWVEAETLRARLAVVNERFAAAADRAAYRRAVELFRAAEGSPDRGVEEARRVVDLGMGVIERGREENRALADAVAATVHATVAEAAAMLWREARDDAARRLASRLYAELLAAHPRDAGFLLAAARHADAAGDRDAAMYAWGVLSAGLTPATNEWYEARCRFIEITAESDPAGAWEALRQHRALYPDLGPPPWDRRLREVEERVARQVGPARGGEGGR